MDIGRRQLLASLASEVNGIASRIGVARDPLSVKEELEKLGEKLTRWSQS